MSGVVVAAVAAAVAVVLQKRRMSKLCWKQVIALYLWRRRFLDRHGLLPPLIVKPVRSRHPGDYLACFRFTRDQFAAVPDAYQLPEYVTCDNRMKVCRWDALGVVLYRLAHPGAIFRLSSSCSPINILFYIGTYVSSVVLQAPTPIQGVSH
jgi:hypothetical protein